MAFISDVNNCEKKDGFQTHLSTMELYPNRGTRLHLIMGFVTVFGIMPVSILLFPIAVTVKLILYPATKYIVIRLVGEADIDRIRMQKNRVLTCFHYLIYKVFYMYNTIWCNSFKKITFDDFWYGLDISPYSGYENYMTSYRNSRVRWRFKKKLKSFSEAGITTEIIEDKNVFFKILFSLKIFKMIYKANIRKNDDYILYVIIFVIIRDYYLFLFLPVRLHIYTKNGEPAGLASYLIRGNTLIMCQQIIADEYSRSGLFYEQMNDLLKYAFTNNRIKYLSCAITTGQAKQTCGFYPVNFLKTDEFSFKPFRIVSPWLQP